MRKTNGKTTKKIFTAILSASLMIGVLAGCGQSGTLEVDGPELDMEEVEEKIKSGDTQEADVTDEEIAEQEAEEGVNPPFLADLETYDSIISGLSKDQYYAFAAVGDNADVLLVTDGVYDNGDGTMAAIDAKVYGVGNNGEVYEAGSIWSDGTAYPLSVYEDMLMFGGNHRVTMAKVIDGSVVIQKEADEVFDEQGNATYSVSDGNIDNIQEVEDDSVLKEMYEMYGNATVINFFQKD